MSVAIRLSDDNLIHRIVQNYGVADTSDKGRSKFVLNHIEQLESSANEAISRTGQVLRRAFDGYGLGYRVPLAVVAMGQALLGVDLAISVPLITSNPVALTCAAVGAIYYGFQALNENERDAMLASVAAGFSFGIELLKSIIDFCISMMRSLLSSENLARLKALVSEMASSFGVSIADITGSIGDRLSSVASAAYENVGYAATNAKAGLTAATDTLSYYAPKLPFGRGPTE
jgi:hypothetical protein